MKHNNSKEYFLSIMESQNKKSVFDSSHDMLHVHRVLKMAEHLQLFEGGDLSIIIPAAILHDYMPVEKNSKLRLSASQISAEAVKELLVVQNYCSKNIEAICHAIEAHSFSAQITPRTIEAKIVQDADRLDSLGAIGLARVFIVGQRINSQIYDPKQKFKKNGIDGDDSQFMIDHFYKKLLKLEGLMNTNTAKKIARKRTKFLQTYLDALEQELGED